MCTYTSLSFKIMQRQRDTWTKWTTSQESQQQVERKIKSRPKSHIHTHTHTHTQIPSALDWQLAMAERMHLSSQGWQNDHADMITSDRTIARGDELSSERFVQPGTRHNSQLKSDAHTEQETVQWRSRAFTPPAVVQMQTAGRYQVSLVDNYSKHTLMFYGCRKKKTLWFVIQFGFSWKYTMDRGTWCI